MRSPYSSQMTGAGQKASVKSKHSATKVTPLSPPIVGFKSDNMRGKETGMQAFFQYFPPQYFFVELEYFYCLFSPWQRDQYMIAPSFCFALWRKERRNNTVGNITQLWWTASTTESRIKKKKAAELLKLLPSSPVIKTEVYFEKPEFHSSFQKLQMLCLHRRNSTVPMRDWLKSQSFPTLKQVTVALYCRHASLVSWGQHAAPQITTYVLICQVQDTCKSS